MAHGRGRVEAAAGLQGLHCGPADGLDAVGAYLGQQAGGPAGTQVVVLVALLIDALDEEVGEVGHHRLRALLLQQVHKVVVGKGHVLHQNFSHDAHTGLAETLVQRQGVEIRHDAPADAAVGIAGLFAHGVGNGDTPPLGVEGVGGAGDGLIGPRAVQAPHEKIAEGQLPQGGQQHGGRDAEALVLLHAVGVQGDNRDVAQPRLVQRPADEGHIVAGAAAAAGLGHDEGQPVGIVPP